MSDFPNEIRTAEQAPQPRRFPCRQCGAKLVYDPAVAALTCEYCGFENRIPQSDQDIRELDFRANLARLAEAEESYEKATIKCGACAAEMEPPPGETAFACPYCGADIVDAARTNRLIKPKAILPFKIPREEARRAFRVWLKSRWFAPSALQKFARAANPFNGMYVPYWTYDCNTVSHYTGQRGDDYWVTQTYTTRQNGRTVTKTRRVRKTRWTSVRGVVWNTFDDLLVVASHSLPDKYVVALEPWDLEGLQPYADAFLSGFRAESYQVDLAEGFEAARGLMDDPIRRAVRRDIGGDHQRIGSLKTQCDDVTFKHLLLPIWINAYRYKARVYRLLVNGRTGEVQGERPWSWIKIALFVIALAGTGVGVYLAAR